MHGRIPLPLCNMQKTLARVAERSSKGEFGYNKFFAIGLFRLLEVRRLVAACRLLTESYIAGCLRPKWYAFYMSQGALYLTCSFQL